MGGIQNTRDFLYFCVFVFLCFYVYVSCMLMFMEYEYVMQFELHAEDFFHVTIYLPSTGASIK